jgi:hypothetical protein
MIGSQHSSQITKQRGIPSRAGLVIAIVLSLGGQLRAQDDPINYTNPFASDGLNTPGLTPLEHDRTALDEIWFCVGAAQREIFMPIPATVSDPHAIHVLREANLLFTMVELRAFVSEKHPSYATQEQRDLVARADPILRALGVRYMSSPKCAQTIADRCDHLGTDRVMKALAPVLPAASPAKL